jgi:enoyl-CoA hydratase/carnithine racemase
MPPEPPLLHPRDLVLGWQGDPLPLAVLDLDDDGVEEIVLPSFPLIGIGDRRHPLAHRVDALVEPPVSLATLVEAIEANPRSAAIVVQLLRHVEGHPVEAALHHESMAYGLLQGSDEHKAWRAGRRKSGRASPPGTVHVSRDGDVLDVVLDRPEASNAVDRGMRDALREAFALAVLDEDIQVRLRAVGKAFCIGAELGEFGTTCDPATAHAIRMETLPAHAIARCADRFSAHVQGACVGTGVEMAAFAHWLTATPNAWFQLPELGMGIIPGAGGCVSVTRRIGRQRAALMILSGKRIGAKTALGWGLVDAIMDDAAADEGGADIAG